MIEMKDKRFINGGLVASNGGGSGSNAGVTNNAVSRHILDLGERIVLNVGGVKYETYRSTLTAYPDTLLGIMFADRNRNLLHPINGNEHFIDRNGDAFYYILEFYRTGKILWREHPSTLPYMSRTSTTRQKAVSREEIEQEIHYFQLPIRNAWSSFTHRAAAAKVDQFVTALKEIVYQVASEFETKVQIDFRRNKHTPHVKIEEVEHESAIIYQRINAIVKPFGSVGYAILEKFGSEIGWHLKCTIPELKWDLKHVDNYNWYSLQIEVMQLFDYEGIIENTCLASTKPLLEY